MKFLGITAALLTVVTPALSYPNYLLAANSHYDDGSTSMVGVACAHGEHGLLTHEYSTFDSLPSFPYIGAAPQITGPGSSYCGSCWELTYTDVFGKTMSINFTAVDAGTADTYTISWAGLTHLMKTPAGDNAVIPITAVRKSPTACHLD